MNKRKMIECPLCGSNSTYTNISTKYTPYRYYARCLTCGCQGGMLRTKRKAKENWNSRPREEELLGALREIHKEVSKGNIEYPIEIAETTLKKYEVGNE